MLNKGGPKGRHLSPSVPLGQCNNQDASQIFLLSFTGRVALFTLSNPGASKPSMESKYLLFKYVSSASIHVYHIQTYWPVCTHVCTSRYTPYTYACTHIYSCVHTQPLVNASCYFWIRWKWKVKVKVTQSYPTFCDPPPLEFSWPEYWSG